MKRRRDKPARGTRESATLTAFCDGAGGLRETISFVTGALMASPMLEGRVTIYTLHGLESIEQWRGEDRQHEQTDQTGQALDAATWDEWERTADAFLLTSNDPWAVVGIRTKRSAR